MHQIDGRSRRTAYGPFNLDRKRDTKLRRLARQTQQHGVVDTIQKDDANLLPGILQNQRLDVVFEDAPAAAKQNVSRSKENRGAMSGLERRLCQTGRRTRGGGADRPALPRLR